MKKLFYTLALLISFSSFGQISLLNNEVLYETYPNILVAYYDINGDLLFDNRATSENISEFINHQDFNKIYLYSEMCFVGDYLLSDAVLLDYYCDDKGNPISIKKIRFKCHSETENTGLLTGTEIHYSRDGKITELIHHNDNCFYDSLWGVDEEIQGEEIKETKNYKDGELIED